MTKKENISFFLDETETEKDTERVTIPDVFFHDMDLLEVKNDDRAIISIQTDDLMPYFLDYQMNYTVKQLLFIAEYYGISKLCKLNKCNKEEIIHQLVIFENEPENENRVIQRKMLWFYMEELKKDKFMKKYILW